MFGGSGFPPCGICNDLIAKSLSFATLSCDFSPHWGLLPCFGRTHPLAANMRFLTIHKLLSANSVISCAVFLANPR